MQGAPRGAFCVCNTEQHVSSRFQRLTAVPISSVQHPCDTGMAGCSRDVPLTKQVACLLAEARRHGQLADGGARACEVMIRWQVPCGE